MSLESGGDGVDLTVSMANRNGKHFLRGCLDTIRAGTHRISYEIIVIDNASTDGSREMLRDEYPEVRVIENESPRGYGASHNQGYEASKGRYFLILNNDMTVDDGALDAMVARIREDASIGLLGCRLRNPDGSLQISCGRESSVLRMLADDLLPARVPAERLGLREWMRNWAHDVERDVDVVQGSCMLLPREVFGEVGQFDESFEFFREEFDLCRRVKLSGRRVVFFPGAQIVHFGGQTMKTIPIPAYQTFFESRYKYFVKYRSRAAAIVVTCSAFIGISARFAAWSALRAIRGNAEGVRDKQQLYAAMVPWFFEPTRPWARSKA